MPRGPQGQKRPADTVGAAVNVAKIATGEVEGYIPSKGREGGLVGGKARAKSLTPRQPSKIARDAARARWTR